MIRHISKTTHSSADRLPALAAVSESERGSALVTALAAMVVLMLFSAVTIQASTTTQAGAKRDSDTKRALAVSDAGASVALLRQNKILSRDDVNPSDLPCLVKSASGELVAAAALADGWCPEVTGEVKGGTYRYRTEPTILQDGVDKIATTRVAVAGEHSGSTRRLLVSASAPTGADPFGGHAVASLSKLGFDGYAKLFGSAGSNEDIVLNGEAHVCGDAEPGPGHSLIRNGTSTQCSGYGSTPSESELIFSPVDQGTAPTVNDNGRLFGQDPRTGNVSWNPDTRQLSLQANQTVTLGGSIYSLCKLSMAGSSSLIIAAGASVQIFFDSPENCGLASGSEQMSIAGSATIHNTNLDPKSLQLFFVGSPTIDTSINITGDAVTGHHFVLYAPYSTVKVSGSSKIHGAIAGRKVSMSGESSLTSDASIDSLRINVIPLFRRDAYIECKPGSEGGAPDADC